MSAAAIAPSIFAATCPNCKYTYGVAVDSYPGTYHVSCLRCETIVILEAREKGPRAE